MLHASLRRIALCGFSLALVAGIRVEAATPPAAAASCDPDGQLRYVCGPVNPEDVIQLGDTRWLLTSGMDGPLNGGAPARGHVYLVDTAAKTWVDWFPGAAPAFRHDTTMFKDCPGPLDITAFSAHGLALRQRSTGRFQLYVTAHGAREAIEVFDVDATGARPAITWVGCVVLPEKVLANSVAILPDGGFVTTQFMDRSLSVNEAFGQVTSGQINGKVYEWHPGGKVEAIAGTELSGANGIVVSPDGRTLYVAAYGTHEVVRFERGAGAVRKQVIDVDITADNLRWTAGGKILAAGGVHGGPPGSTGWAVLEIDPQTLATRRCCGPRLIRTSRRSSSAASSCMTTSCARTRCRPRSI
jgi:sugar lactone lactonase YvrE